LGFLHIISIAISAKLVFLIMGGFFFGENDLNFRLLWANLNPIFIKEWVVSLIDELLVIF